MTFHCCLFKTPEETLPAHFSLFFSFLSIYLRASCCQMPNSVRQTKRTNKNPMATICDHHNSFLKSVQTSTAWDQNLHVLHFTMFFTVALIDVRICYLYFHECIHFQHGWTERSECDQLSDVTALYMSTEALSWAGSNCSLTISAASSQFDMDQYAHKGPLVTRHPPHLVFVSSKHSGIDLMCPHKARYETVHIIFA